MKFSAPSNIALIKYMGKTAGNRPTNASLSYTLPKLLSYVDVTAQPSGSLEAAWEALPGFEPLVLSEKGRAKFLNHFLRIVGDYGVKGVFLIRSGNDFPAACGIASSASSFAALTKAACHIVSEQTGQTFSNEQMSQLSQKGSGSSCRSFFSHWSLWEDQGACAVDLPFQDLLHDVVVVSEDEKDVSSSQAHERVTSSLLFKGRTERASMRLEDLTKALQSQDWRQAMQITWAEFWDMHALFETSQPSFGYMSAKSLEVLECVQSIWKQNEDGPIVTMDAGPNVHLLWRKDQAGLRSQLKGFKTWSGT